MTTSEVSMRCAECLSSVPLVSDWFLLILNGKTLYFCGKTCAHKHLNKIDPTLASAGVLCYNY